MRNYLLSALAGMLLIGCANSPSPRFYVLSPEAPGPVKTGDTCATIGVGPIELPGYLDRPQIATTVSENELIYSDFNRWAHPLSNDFPTVLAENIARMVCTKAVYVFPWYGAKEPDYRIEAKVMSLNGVLGANATMDVWWVVLEGKEKKAIVDGRSRYTEPVQSRDYQALVQAYSKILAAFSRDVVKTVQSR